MLPLESVKVLDLTRYMSGPYCTMVLGDLGAEVIKVERFPGGDDARRLGPHVNGESYCFAMINRHKKSVALDLKNGKGREIAQHLAREADVVVENFRPGVTERLGMDYHTLSGLNRGLIYASITGFGQTGPYAHRPGFDIMAQGVSGLMRMTGQPEDAPVKVGIAVNDIAAGITAAVAVLGAYIHRQRTGEGQYIDVSLVDAALAWTIWESAAFFGAGELPQPTGSRHRRTAPYQAYRTKDGYVTVGANNDRLWQRFCEKVVERPEWLEDPRYKEPTGRLENNDALQADVEAVFEQRDTAEWIDLLDAAGVPGGPVYTYDQTLADPHVLAREMVVDAEHPRIGPIKSLGMPIKYSQTPLSIREVAPTLGQHTAEALGAIGYRDDEIADLHRAGVIHDGIREGEADA
ncbi:MAG: CoA transferase [Nitriliruptorales bacterium]|nr:CoA transferase [Nitriliruptorales bacterium]